MKKEKPRVHVPRSALADVVWPALPNPIDTMVLALQQQFETSQWWPAGALRTLQLRQFGALCVHAGRTVPFYRERLGKAGAPGKLTMETWSRIPVLERTDIQEAGQDLLSRLLPKGHGPTADVSTSGSTGSPVTVKSTNITNLFLQVLNLRNHLWHRHDFTAKVAGITNREPTTRGRSQNWVSGYASGPMVTFDVTRPPAEQLAWLAEVDPAYLLTYPSNLLGLLRKSRETGARVPGLAQVSTMGEVLDAHVREACEREWGVPVTDLYSSQEVGVIALQCPEHPHYHVQSESIFLEILDGDGTPCEPGLEGHIVVTDLHNFATPLIRYEIGDYGEFGGPCPCGRGLPVLTRVLGRTRNMATLPNGEQFWPRYFSDYLDTVAPVSQAQLVQHTVDEIEVRIVAKRQVTPAEETRLGDAILEYLGHPFVLRFTYMDEIPRSANGKFEDFMSKV